ncbi:MAG: amino acid adenylation domain-containing protein, partial [Catenulispora sp.]|nr:amino acid adenylation domain-containing protein [Catenulispora sp.]
ERWNDTARPYPVPGPIHLLFEQRAAAVPGAVALLWRDGGRMTYGELNRRANRIAWHLIEAGVGPGTVVGVSGHRGPDLVAMVFGVLKAGGAYLPVEPHLPADRAAVMLRDADARLLLTRSGTRRWAEPDGVHAIDVDRLPEISDGREDRDPAPRARPDDTAYIIFTSGSTGTPKGVEVTHRPVHNLLAWCRRTFDFGPADVGLSVTSLGFDLSVFDVFGLLGCGAGIYLADEAEQRDPALLLDVLLNEPITFWNSAPTTLNQLAGLLPAHVGRPGTDRLRLVFLSGDYTPLPLPDEVRAVFPGARMVSLGGATEATVWSNYFVIDRVDPAWRSIPYGRPIDNARYYILDPDGRPCPVGVEGDLFIGGECLAIGYRKRPDLTAERFVRDPFRADPDARMYRTGDRAMFWADGTIEFLGRADHQVKIRGFRVELGEIEHRLREHPAVKDAVVLAKPDGTGDRKLVAYVIASGEPPAVSELRAFSARTLPDYMVPNYLAVVPSFPATANGKLDREALPWPLLPDDQGTAGLAGVGQDAVGPHTAIAAIFAELLGGVPVEPDADLWDQGATSFTMVQASARLQERFGRRIEVATLLSEPTIAGIARHFADSAPPVDTARPVDIAPTPATTPEPTAAPTPPRAPDSVDFFSTSARDAFKSAAWNLRPRRSDEPVLPLHTAPDDEHRAHRAKRRSRREFVGDPVPAATLSQLLDVLRTVPGEDGHTRARYPSAGDTYAVQTYLHLRPGGVDGLAPGLYYYRPDEPALHLIDPAPDLDRHLHFYYNRPLFDAAAFELYLVGQTKGIAPLYAERSELYLAVEAGYMGHLLMEAQPELGLGLCPIGALDEDRLAAALALDDGHRFLHAFLGGVVEPDNAVPDDNATPDNTVACAVPARLLAPSTTAPAPTATDAIAVIGACGRYPGADHLDDLWRLLHSGGHALGRPAAGRGDLVGGYLSDIESFDSLLFHVSPAEAATLDPQARLLLEAVWSCLENAGHTAASLRAGAPRVGVFVGVMWHDHQLTGWDELRATGRSQASSLAAELPNRISHCFDFTGPSVAVNTSCSSSLTALHLAAESLRHGQCDAAVVGAVNLIAHPFHGALLSGLDLLDPSGLGLAFGADSSGWVPAEGVGALLLRPEPAALAGRDRLHAVIESTWIGHSGHSVRYGAPNADALAGSVRAALLAAGRTPEEIDYVECAAAGAGVADAAELSALDTVFGGRSVPVGTVKPHVGHAEAAAGMAQIAKVLMQFRHRRLAPTLVAGRRSPLVGWDALGLRVVAEAEDFQPRTPGAPLRTLINSLGATGSYGHAVLRSSSADG